MPKSTFGQRLKKFRESYRLQRTGITPTELAALAGISAQAVRHLEADRNEPTLPVVRRLAKALGVEPSALIDG